MKSRTKTALALSTVLGAAALMGVAYAQQGPAGGPPAAAPHRASPMAPFARGPHRAGFGMMRQLARLSPGDRTAVIDAKLAAIKAGLELNSAQEPLWAPVEKSVKDGLAQAFNMRDEFQKDGAPTDPMQRLSRMSEMATARAAALKNFVSAAGPLYATLTPEQKARLPLLMGVAREIGGGPGPMMGRLGLHEGGLGAWGHGPGRWRRWSGPMDHHQGFQRDEDHRGPWARDDNDRRQDRRSDENWRERMQRRMEEMNRDRREWRGPQLGPGLFQDDNGQN